VSGLLRGLVVTIDGFLYDADPIDGDAAWLYLRNTTLPFPFEVGQTVRSHVVGARFLVLAVEADRDAPAMLRRMKVRTSAPQGGAS